MVYSDAHRLFLQVLSMKRSMDEKEASELMVQCCKQYGGRAQSLERFVVELNSELQDMQLAIRNATEERDDGDYPCLVLANMMPGMATRDLSSFSKIELTYIQHLVGEIIAAENGELPMNIALNIGSTLPTKMKPSACEDLIQLLLKDKWLIRSLNSDGEECLSLSGLTMVELGTYLEETHPADMRKCFFCAKMTFKGYRCDQCSVSVHRSCGKKYWKNRGGVNECPGEGCNASLLLQASSSQPKQSRRNHTEEEEEEESEVEETVQEQEQEEEEEEDEDEDVVMEVAKKRKTQPSTVRSRRK